MFDTSFLIWLGLMIMVIGIMITVVGVISNNIKTILSGMAVLILDAVAVILALYGWDASYLSIQDAVAAVPTWVWVVVGVTTYFTLNHIYTTWGVYATKNPNSWAKKILYPWPLDKGIEDTPMLPIVGSLFFVATWLISIHSYAAWLIFGGGIAKLLHLVPRE